MKPTELYRHYNADGDLLYVGVSTVTLMRIAGHRCSSNWWSDVVSIDIERFPDRTKALEAERTAIKTENPLFNVEHNRNNVRAKNNIILNGIAVAKIFKCDPKTLRRWLKSGTCPVAPIPGMLPPRWRRVDIDAWARGEA